jgi:hypothetical protein
MSPIDPTPTPAQDYLRLLPAAFAPSPAAAAAAIALDAMLGKAPARRGTVPFVVSRGFGAADVTPVLTVPLRDFIGDALRGAMLEEAIARRGGADTDRPGLMSLSEEGANELTRAARGVLDSRDSARTLARSVAQAAGYAGLMSEIYAAIAGGGTFAVAAAIFVDDIGPHSALEAHVVPLPVAAPALRASRA